MRGIGIQLLAACLPTSESPWAPIWCGVEERSDVVTPEVKKKINVFFLR